MRLTVTTTIFGLAGGPRASQVQVTLPSAALSVRELIACKILQEVGECRSQSRPALGGEYWTAERLLADAPGQDYLPVEPEEEVRRAQEAFAARAFMILVDNRRMYSPDDQLTLSSSSRVEFIRIMPMVGGV